jgi:hypothetical protein
LQAEREARSHTLSAWRGYALNAPLGRFDRFDHCLNLPNSAFSEKRPLFNVIARKCRGRNFFCGEGPVDISQKKGVDIFYDFIRMTAFPFNL